MDNVSEKKNLTCEGCGHYYVNTFYVPNSTTGSIQGLGWGVCVCVWVGGGGGGRWAYPLRYSFVG